MKRESGDSSTESGGRFCSYLASQQTSVNQPSRTARRARLFTQIALGGLILAARTAAQDEPVAQIAALRLDRYVVSASRTPQDARYTPSSVTVVPLEDLAAAQVTTLQAALAEQPGVVLYNNGGVGSQSTILLRGANAHQTLFVVDGVRMNDRSASFQNFLGGADLGGIDRIEVLRGPQSTLYGSSAMGGVILVDTTRGEGPLAGTLTGAAGSFDSYGAGATVKGAQGPVGYSASISHYETENDRADNAFDLWSSSSRLDYTATPALLVGATFRRQDSTYHEPGSRLYLWPGTVDFTNYLATAYGEVKVGEQLTSRLTLAAHVRDYLFTDAFGLSPQRNVRKILDWQNAWEASSRAQLVAGLNLEQSRYTVSGTPSSDHVAAGYVSATVRPTDTVTLTGGVRHDDFRSVGGATTGRLGAAWRMAAATKLRATYGTGFAAPGSDDVYGVPSYNQLPNPALLPEKSRGWDAGVDQELFDGAVTVGATYFKNKFENLFEYDTVDYTTFAGRTVNRARATTDGAELALSAKLAGGVKVRGSYTYLEAVNDVTGERLARRPRHMGDLEVTWTPTKAWLLGAGVHVVASRLNGTTPIEDYTVARVFASYQVRRDLSLKARVENALDEHYEEVLGYPTLPRAVYGSVEWRF